MKKIEQKELLKAGVHFGHLKRKWNPQMLQYIFMEKKGIHLIDLNKTSEKLLEAAAAMRQIASSGRKILFVATKKQAKETVKTYAQSVNMPYVTERWLGGMLTNFGTIRKSIKKMQTIEDILSDETNTSLTKKERLMLSRQQEKLNTVLGGIEKLNRLPSAIFVVDINHEHIAIKEAEKLGITTFGMVDTNSNPNQVDFPIPANDDASKSIDIITKYLVEAIREGLENKESDKKAEKEGAETEKEEAKAEEK
ncbi:MAG: 30S ribosomal protein S2 [Bacteroidetes bacterium]|nr:30S ribosomal protein S2 [Bacteroidota bacterium]MCB9226374.1 30S ribosomal protein S2 [Chitinophagales bacterium]